MTIGPSTKNSTLAEILMGILDTDETIDGLSKRQLDAVVEAADRFREMSYYDDEGDTE